MHVKIIKFNNQDDLQAELVKLGIIYHILPHKYARQEFGETEVLKEVLVIYE